MPGLEPGHHRTRTAKSRARKRVRSPNLLGEVGEVGACRMGGRRGGVSDGQGRVGKKRRPLTVQTERVSGLRISVPIDRLLLSVTFSQDPSGERGTSYGTFEK